MTIIVQLKPGDYVLKDITHHTLRDWSKLMAIKHITRDEIDGILEKAGTHFLSVTFQKADSSIRTLQGHLKVRKFLKGGASTIAHKPNLVSIFDVQKSEYRCFDKTRVKSLRVNGDVYKIKEEEEA